ncbi:MAG: ABC-2 transporter permease [Spirochaetes bacterium]|nr:ABC-2 transporter permease [Spirochaetota bacterium]
MFALLYKDWLLLRKEKMIIVVALFSLAFGAVAGGSGSGLLAVESKVVIYILLLPSYMAIYYSNAYDYKYGCEPLLACLPPGRRAVVGSTFLLVLSADLLIPAAAIVRLAATALGLGGGAFPWETYATAISFSLFLAAVELAAYFRFGYMKSRWAAMGAFVLVGIAGGLIGEFSGSTNVTAGAPRGGGAVLVLLGTGVLFFALSFLYSARIYERKEF